MADILYSLRIQAPAGDYDAITGLLARDVNFGWEEKSLPDGAVVWIIQCENGEFLARVAAEAEKMAENVNCAIETVAKKDWQAAWREFFTPVQAGPFTVLPPWLANSAPGTCPVIIEPKSAFGTGHHATTALCLVALGRLLADERVRAGQTFLDLGCGSGVLGIACAKSGLTGWGIDIDPLAVENANENIALNSVQGLATGEGGIELAAGKEFDLILANILSGPLIEMASQISDALKPGGCLVLSGILDSQADSVEQAYVQAGLMSLERLQDDEWRALILEKGK